MIIPAGQSGQKEIGGIAEYVLDGLVNPATADATHSPLQLNQGLLFHSADYREPRWENDGTEIGPVLSY